MRWSYSDIFYRGCVRRLKEFDFLFIYLLHFFFLWKTSFWSVDATGNPTSLSGPLWNEIREGEREGERESGWERQSLREKERKEGRGRRHNERVIHCHFPPLSCWFFSTVSMKVLTQNFPDVRPSARRQFEYEYSQMFAEGPSSHPLCCVSDCVKTWSAFIMQHKQPRKVHRCIICDVLV